MYTVRQLILDAFRKSTVRGVGDIPDEEELSNALSDLNDFLDEFTGNPDFTPAKRCVEVAVGDGGFITFSNDPRRVVASAVLATTEDGTHKKLTVHTVGEHLIDKDLDDVVELHLDGKVVSFGLGSVNVEDMFTFSVEGNAIFGPLGEGVYRGSWKYGKESKDYRIDIPEVPPVNIYQVVSMDNQKLPELQEQDFYARGGNSGKWYFYDKGRYPYARLWVGGEQYVRVIYEDQRWHDLSLDDNAENFPKVAVQVMKWRLAADIAVEYPDVAERMEKRFRSSLMTYYRSNKNSESPLPDSSAPGYGGRRYNIYKDE